MPVCSVAELQGRRTPSDEEVNRAYNIFDAEKMKYFKGVFVRTDRDFTGRKTEKPEEWRDFSEIVSICDANGFDLACYIKYCFLNRLVPRSRGRTLSDASYLRNAPQLIAYAKDRNNIERLFRIYRSVQKTILLVRRMSKESGSGAKETIRRLLSSGKLSTYVSTGVVSPYFVSLIPNAAVLVHRLMDRGNEDRVVLIDLCNGMPTYGADAQRAMSMFYPSSMSKSVVELCT